MALKKKITKEVFEKLAEDLKKFYVEKDGAYNLDLDGDEDNGALKRAKDREKQRADDLEAKLATLQEQLDDLSTNDAKKKGDIKTLEAQWQKKITDADAIWKAKLDKRDAFINKSLVDETALALATKISTVPTLMKDHISKRLSVSYENDEPKLVIFGTDGKPSDMTIAKLSEEFVANKDFGSIIVASKATGGGAGNHSLKKPLGGAENNPDKPVILAKMNPADLAAELKARKESQQ